MFFYLSLNKYFHDVSEKSFLIVILIVQYINQGYILASIWLICVYRTLMIYIVYGERNHSFWGSLNQLSISYFFHCCDKTLDNSKLRKENIISAHG